MSLRFQRNGSVRINEFIEKLRLEISLNKIKIPIGEHRNSFHEVDFDPEKLEEEYVIATSNFTVKKCLYPYINGTIVKQLQLAVKVIDIPAGKVKNNPEVQRMQERIFNEVKIHIKLGAIHENIVHYYGACLLKNQLLLCLEYMDYSLADIYYLFHTHRYYFPENLIAAVAVAVINALNYCKENQKLNIIHRDLKPNNILVNMNGEIKLCDFGASGILEQSNAVTYLGTIGYWPPERFLENQNFQFDVRADVWSLGMMLLELAWGKFPYNTECRDLNVIQQFVTTTSPDELMIRCLSQEFSDECREFISLCLEKLENRPKYPELMTQAFYRRYAKLTHDDIALMLEPIKPYTISPPISRENSVRREPAQSYNQPIIPVHPENFFASNPNDQSHPNTSNGVTYHKTPALPPKKPRIIPRSKIQVNSYVNRQENHNSDQNVPPYPAEIHQNDLACRPWFNISEIQNAGNPNEIRINNNNHANHDDHDQKSSPIVDRIEHFENSSRSTTPIRAVDGRSCSSSRKNTIPSATICNHPIPYRTSVDSGTSLHIFTKRIRHLILTILWFFSTLTIYFSALVLGIVKLDNCNGEPMIPKCLIFTGIFGILHILSDLLNFFMKYFSSKMGILVAMFVVESFYSASFEQGIIYTFLSVADLKTSMKGHHPNVTNPDKLCDQLISIYVFVYYPLILVISIFKIGLQKKILRPIKKFYFPDSLKYAMPSWKHILKPKIGIIFGPE